MEKTSRRDFIKKAAVTAGTAVGAQVLGLPQILAAPGASATLGVAVVGAGGMGGYGVDMALRERFVAVCDVDEGKIAEAMKKFNERQPGKPAPKVYYDYRKMIEECKDIDVVLISTPDHHHAPAAIRAINAGMHVFAQKPLAHNIYECYALAKAAKEKKVLTQMGNQGHCGEGLRRACEYLWAGAVGDVTETHTILGRNFGGSGGRPESKPVPKGLHWDEWLGPAPYRDYHDGLHTFSWRDWRQFGTGTIGDMACHNLDCVFFALRVGEAKSFTVECLNIKNGSEEKWSQDNIVRYVVPARAGMPAVTINVYDHQGLKPEVMKATEKENEADGVKFGECTLYLGSKGKFWTTGTAGGARMLPLSEQEKFPAPEKTLWRAKGGPIEDLFFAIKTGVTTPCSNFTDASGPLTAFALAGHLAQRAGVGKKVEWDVEKMECTNLPEINQYVRRTYRPGWEV